MIDAPVASRYEGILQGPKAQHFQLLCLIHFLQSSLFICSLAKASDVYLAPPEKSRQAKKKKQFYQNLHTNWSDIKGLTDTSALSGALEIKTSGSELWRSLLFPMCARHPSRWAARAVYRSLCHISHIPATRVKNLGAYRATWPRSVIRADEDGRWKARRGEEEKRLGAQHVAGWKMKKWVAQQREPRGSYGSGKADQWLSPRGRLHRIHTMRDRNMAAAHFFSPNYQTPYWLSSGREEVILFLSPFGKLIHFTKVTW